MGVPISREKILLELIPDSLQLQITVRTELKGEQMSNLSWLIFAAVDALVKEWYNLNVRRIRPSPSPSWSCITPNLSDLKPY